MDITKLTKANADRWSHMKLRPERLDELHRVAQWLIRPAAKAWYVYIQEELVEEGHYVPWWVIAVIHERECAQRWDCYLGQGDPLSRRTVHEPAGRGPFYGKNAFLRGSLDALINCHPYAAKWKDWSIGGTLTLLEEYNGLGYAMRGVPSAYVWSGSDQYEHGKYIADHRYSANAVDVQEGCAPLLQCMMLFDPTIVIEGSSEDKPPPPVPDTPTMATAAPWPTPHHPQNPEPAPVITQTKGHTLMDITTIEKDVDMALSVAEKLLPFISIYSPQVANYLSAAIAGVRVIEKQLGVAPTVGLLEATAHVTPGAANSRLLS
jgi:lysozyme family protein